MDTDNELAITTKSVPVWNKRWLNLIPGSNTKKYTPEQLLTGANEYFQYCIDNPIKSPQLLTGGMKAGDIKDVNKPQMFMLEGLCIWIGTNTQYLYDIEQSIKDKTDEDSLRYSFVIKYVRDVIRLQRVTLAAANELNPLIVSRIEGLKDSVEHSGEIKQTYTSIVFQTRNVEEVTGEDVTDQARTALDAL